MKNLLLTAALFSFLPAYADAPKPAIQLVLVISIDQMRFDYLERFGSLYKYGIKTLKEDGAVFTQARYRHANTETGPGHAVILSGKHSSHSGIVANSWYDSYEKKLVNVIDDPLHQAVGGKGRAASPANFVGFMLGDALKMHMPDAKVVGVSTKDRAAILMAGKLADGAFWFERADGGFVTSTYYMQKPLDWQVAWNGKHFVDQFANQEWKRLFDDKAIYEKLAGPDAVHGERDNKDIVFPHKIHGARSDPAFYEDFLRTPFADEMILDFALAAKKAYHLGEDATPDIFAISFSATDYIGHTYGPDSQEIMDQMLRLDQLLGKLFGEIDLNKTLVVLTADHGVDQLVENAKSKKLFAQRIKPAELQSKVESALQKRFGKSKELIAFADAPNFWLDRAKIGSLGIKADDVESEIIKSLMSSGLVRTAYRKSDFFKEPPKSDAYFSLFQNSFFASRSPDISASLKEHIYVDDRPGGTGHGTPYDYDRHVPIIFMGPNIASGSYSQPCGPEDIAPTLAHILKLDYPKEDDARLLLEMLH